MYCLAVSLNVKFSSNFWRCLEDKLSVSVWSASLTMNSRDSSMEIPRYLDLVRLARWLQLKSLRERSIFSIPLPADHAPFGLSSQEIALEIFLNNGYSIFLVFHNSDRKKVLTRYLLQKLWRSFAFCPVPQCFLQEFVRNLNFSIYGIRSHLCCLRNICSVQQTTCYMLPCRQHLHVFASLLNILQRSTESSTCSSYINITGRFPRPSW